MKKQKKILKVLKYEHLNCSYYGNPKKRLFLEDKNGHTFTAKTATNTMCGYISPRAGAFYEFTYHYTKNLNVIIDDYSQTEAGGFKND